MEIKRVTTLGDEILKNLTSTDLHNFVNGVVKPDYTLSKLFQFAFTPPIEDDFSTYPVDQKIQEIDNISESDWEHFFDRFYASEGLYKECFKFFKFRFQAIYGCINYFKYFRESNNSLELVFIHTSHNSLTEFIDDDNIRKFWISIGKYWPHLWLDYLSYPDKNVVECHVNWLMRCPKTNDLKNEANEWEIHSFGLYKDLSDTGYSQILSGYETKLVKDCKVKFRILYYYCGKQLQLTKRGYFVFPIIHRYEPLSKKYAKRLRWQYDSLDSGIKYEVGKISEKISEKRNRDLKKESLWETKRKILNLAKKYEKSNTYPPGYLKNMLKWIGKEIFEGQSTTAIPGSQSHKDPKPYCDPDCKKQKKYEDELPCEFETVEGYCKDPARKRERKLNIDIEQEGPSLDEFEHSDNGWESDALRKIEKFEANQENLTSLIINKGIKEKFNQIIINGLNKKERRLYQAHYIECLKQKDIAKELGMAQSTVSENLKKLKTKLIKLKEKQLKLDLY